MPTGVYKKNKKVIFSEHACENMSQAMKKRWSIPKYRKDLEKVLSIGRLTYSKNCEKKKIEKRCEVCDKYFKIVKCHSVGRRYCSQKCYGVAKKGKPWQENMSLFLPKKEKHYNWSGGFKKSRLPTTEDIEWRTKVFVRDRYTCQECKKKGGYLEAHHIKRKCDFPELKHVIDNDITLCYDCHKRTYFKEEKFQEKYEYTNTQRSLETIIFTNYALH